MKIVLGETRGDAISRVQERLGPATSRPIAEQTFWSLAEKGKVTMDEKGSYLIEADIDDNSLRQEATNNIQKASTYQMHMKRARGIRHFVLNHNSMHKARVSSMWNCPTAKTVFAPSLSDDDPNNAN